MMRIFITGGCGYVGSALVPFLLDKEHEIVVMDLQWFGNTLPDHDNLTVVKEDIRNKEAVAYYIRGCDAVIHLACISNDVSLELNPQLGKSINYDCFPSLVKEAKKAGVSRFIYASSSSVYGIKTEDRVTEDLSLEPMTDYAKYKALCEPILLNEANDNFCVTILRPGAVCGYAPRLRLDLVVNMLTAQAYFNNKIIVFGGEQSRSHLHIKDMVATYGALIDASKEQYSAIQGQIFNVSNLNMTVMKLAELIAVQQGLSVDKDIEVRKSYDKRSYHICSDKIINTLGLRLDRQYKVGDAIMGLWDYFNSGEISDPFSSQYINIKRMKELEIV